MTTENKFKAIERKLDSSDLLSLSITYDYKINTVCLDIIVVKKELRRKGIASKILAEICQLCDDENVLFVLLPSSEFGVSKAILERFYRGFGFTYIGERDYFDRYSVYMKRFPKPPHI